MYYIVHGKYYLKFKIKHLLSYWTIFYTGGRDCIGLSFDSQECIGGDCNIIVDFAPIDGGWSGWGNIGTCSSNCQQRQTRTCTNPRPEFGGLDCFGDSSRTVSCTGGQCGKEISPNFNIPTLKQKQKTCQPLTDCPGTQTWIKRTVALWFSLSCYVFSILQV